MRLSLLLVVGCLAVWLLPDAGCWLAVANAEVLQLCPACRLPMSSVCARAVNYKSLDIFASVCFHFQMQITL